MYQIIRTFSNGRFMKICAESDRLHDLRSRWFEFKDQPNYVIVNREGEVIFESRKP